MYKLRSYLQPLTKPPIGTTWSRSISFLWTTFKHSGHLASVLLTMIFFKESLYVGEFRQIFRSAETKLPLCFTDNFFTPITSLGGLR